MEKIKKSQRKAPRFLECAWRIYHIAAGSTRRVVFWDDNPSSFFFRFLEVSTWLFFSFILVVILVGCAYKTKTHFQFFHAFTILVLGMV